MTMGATTSVVSGLKQQHLHARATARHTQKLANTDDAATTKTSFQFTGCTTV